MTNYSVKDGEFLVSLARQAISTFFSKREVIPAPKCDKKFKEQHGVFVTLETFPRKTLRGCIGFPRPTKPLVNAVLEAAIASAFSDPRFRSLSPEELDLVIIEVTVLGVPEELKKPPQTYPEQIKIGEHGLIMEYEPFSGLLLPQVAVEYGWDAEEFLKQTAVKAGLTVDMFLDEHTRVYRFTGQVFSEESPGGKVVERKIAEESASK